MRNRMAGAMLAGALLVGAAGPLAGTAQANTSAHVPTDAGIAGFAGDNDPGVTLLEEWAKVADALAACQERTAAEAHLDTATARDRFAFVTRLTDCLHRSGC